MLLRALIAYAAGLTDNTKEPWNTACSWTVTGSQVIYSVISSCSVHLHYAPELILTDCISNCCNGMLQTQFIHIQLFSCQLHIMVNTNISCNDPRKSSYHQLSTWKDSWTCKLISASPKQIWILHHVSHNMRPLWLGRWVIPLASNRTEMKYYLMTSILK